MRWLSTSAVALLLANVALADDPPPEAPKEEAKPEESKPEESSAPADDKKDHRQNLDALNKRADELQVEIGKAGEQLFLLRESVAIGAIAPTKLVLVHDDTVSGFDLKAVTYTLDGATILSETYFGPDGKSPPKRKELVNEEIAPGEHEVQVSMTFASASYGLFTYVEGYTFRIASKYRLDAKEGRINMLYVRPFAKEDLTLPAEQRLAIRYDHEPLLPEQYSTQKREEAVED